MSDTASPLAIAAQALTLQRGGRRLVDGLDLAVCAGEAIELVGPNGSGKTTLLRALAGLVRPEAGRVETPGPDAIAFSGHADALKPGESVAQALGFWARFHGRAQGEIDAALDAFGAVHLKRRMGERLSAGQRRRVSLARVKLTGRPVWLLDEPAAPLDAAGRNRLAAAVAAHRASGGIVVAATHLGLGWDGARRLDLAGFDAACDAAFDAGPVS